MVFARRRYYFWLTQAYVRKWKKTILGSVVIGIIIFFAVFFTLNFYFRPFFDKTVTKIGFTGLYTPTNLPEAVWDDVSYGLTDVAPDGSVKSAAASKWEVKSGGKQYIFTLKKGQFFENGQELTASNLPVEFKDVQKKVIGPYTVAFELKSAYAPFLATVSKPIFQKNFSGLAGYKVKKIDSSAGYVKSITLEKRTDTKIKKMIYFYPSEEALKIAYMLGEVDTIDGIHSLTINSKDLSKWKNTNIKKVTNHTVLITIFYNNNDPELSNKRLREALNYAIPEKFSHGKRAYSPLPPNSAYYGHNTFPLGDMEIAKTLFKEAGVSKDRVFEIDTTPELKETAEIVQKAWNTLGFKTKINVVNEIPSDFQILLYQFSIPKDPDQYTLWHSRGVNNIANFRKNKRVDKLLEDGRVTTSLDQRKNIYAEFQKYLVDDVPASFLYFPYEYQVVRK